MKIDITKEMALYRDAMRNLWNHHYLFVGNDFNVMDSCDLFETLAKHSLCDLMELMFGDRNAKIEVKINDDVPPQSICHGMRPNHYTIAWRSIENRDLIDESVLRFVVFFDFACYEQIKFESVIFCPDSDPRTFLGIRFRDNYENTYMTEFENCRFFVDEPDEV